jgi:hypothetical protein
MLKIDTDAAKMRFFIGVIAVDVSVSSRWALGRSSVILR